MSSDLKTIKAPFDDEQVARLNEYQTLPVRPYVCTTAHRIKRKLVATKAGWICKECNYKQNWAFAFSVHTREIKKAFE